MKKNGDIVPFLKQKDYEMVNNNLGGGSFGKTVLVKDPFIDELFVVKKYEPEIDDIKEKFYKNFLDEIKILHKLNHPNIVRVYNYYAYENIHTGYILMEFIDGKNIGEYITEYVDICDTPSLDKVFLQIIDAFCYIEKHGIIHRDIREGNILVNKEDGVKVIDFGIGKIFAEKKNGTDSLVADINRAASDTLPQEYYEGVYTSQTDMFYVAELFNRLLKGAKDSEGQHFSYQEVLNKMMEKAPQNRYITFNDVKEAVSKHDFLNIDISKKDKEIYQSLAKLLGQSLQRFHDEQKFNYDTKIFIAKLEKVLRENIYEEEIQKNSDVLSCVIIGNYTYKNDIIMPTKVVKEFLDWFKLSSFSLQKLILTNLISKLSIAPIENTSDLPF